MAARKHPRHREKPPVGPQQIKPSQAEGDEKTIEEALERERICGPVAGANQSPALEDAKRGKKSQAA